MSRRIRLAFCLDNGGIGGSELNAVRTAERLDPARYDIEVLSFNDYEPLARRYEACGIPVRRLDVRSLRSADALSRGWWLARHLRARRVDVFHAHDTYGNVFGVPWARLAGVSAVIASRRWWKEPPTPAHAVANRWVARVAHAIVTNSQAVAALVVREGARRHKVRIVPNFLDEDSFRPPGVGLERRVREELNIPAGAPVIGIVAQLRPEKDHATLLRAMRRLADTHPDAHLILVGEGTCRTQIEAQRAELGLGDRVHLVGLRRDEGNWHHLFDVSVLCSRTEALSNSILEAMAAGRPVVATDVGGNPDCVTHAGTGLLVPVGDDAALAAALDRLLSHPGEARRLGGAGLRRARSDYSADAAIGALERVYADLIGFAGAKPGAAAANAA